MSMLGNISQGTLKELGTGIPVDPRMASDTSDEFDVLYSHWDKGIYSDVASEDVPDGGVCQGANVEFQYNAIRTSPAYVNYPGMFPSGSTPDNIWPQVSAGANEMFQINAPNILYSNNNGAFTVVNVGLDQSVVEYQAANVNGTMIFSNNVKSYIRAGGAAVVTDVSAQVIAGCFATAFGRVFAGNYTFSTTDNSAQSMGVTWNAASGVVGDWTGLGSGSQVLIANNFIGDKVMALVPVGLQALVVICRRSLWVGYPTGDSFQPVTFQLRVQGVGCVNGKTAVAVPSGVMFLADDGVYLFDLNTAQMVSRPINSILLADVWDTSGGTKDNGFGVARAAYSVSIPTPDTRAHAQAFYLHRYYLTFGNQATAHNVYVYDFPDPANSESLLTTLGRWWIRPYTSAVYVDQSWDGSVLFGDATVLGFEGYQFAAFSASSFTLPERSKFPADINQILSITVQYSLATGGGMQVTFGFHNQSGNVAAFPQTITRLLPATSVRTVATIPLTELTTLGTQLSVSIVPAGIYNIEKILLHCKHIGPSLTVQL